MDMSLQHIRLMEVAEILRRASNERTSSLTSEASRLRSSRTDQDGREIGVRSRPWAELLIDCEEDRTLRAVLVRMLREAERGR